MSRTFEAAVLRQAATSTPYARSRPLTVETVTVADPGEHEVLVRVEAASLCRSDLSVVDGVRAWPMPIVPGHEASGVVEEVGRGVTGFSPGDHVVLIYQACCGTCRSCSRGDAHLCEPGLAANRRGELLEGGTRLRCGDEEIHHHMGLSAFAQYALVSRHSLVSVESDLPFETAALFGCGVMCGAGSVLNTAAVRPGESVTVVGVGGVGSSAVLGAVAAGAERIIAVDVDPRRLEFALGLGATDAILAEDPDSAADRVLELTGGGTDVALESAGTLGAFTTAFESVRRGGRVVTLGLVSPETPFSLDVAALVTSAKTVRGSYMGSCDPRRDIPRFITWYREGRLPLDRLITHRWGLSDINTALDHMVAREGMRQMIRPWD